MRNPFRKQVEVRTQGALIPLGDTRVKGNYISNIIKKKYYDFYKIDHRKAVCQLDGKAARLVYRWAERCVAKTFKFYSSHEVDGEEIMQDQRARWVELNANEIFKLSIISMIRDGFVLLDLNKKEDSIDYKVYGEYECPPILWARDNSNKIIAYKAQYTPQPRAMGSSAGFLQFLSGPNNMKAISKDYLPKDLIHVEYGIPNMGCGMPLIEACWDSLIKLCGESHQNMLDKRSIPTLDVTEDEYSEDNSIVKAMLKNVANSDSDTARVWYHKKLMDGTVSEYPKFAYKSPTSDPDNTARHEGKSVGSGDYGNLSEEWANLCTITGHTVHYFIGNRAGAVVGSETDQWDDIQQEIADFALLEPLIRKILEWLASEDLMTLPKEPFVIKYWRDWENIEKKALEKEEMQEQMKLKQTQGEDVDADPQDNKQLPDKRNLGVIIELVKSMRNNMSYAMTDVMSTWIDQIGYDDKTDKLFAIFKGVVYSKPAPMGEWSFEDWEDSDSKGRYFWDYLSQRDPPWQRDTIPEHLLVHFMQEKTFEKQNIDTIKVPILDYTLIDELDTETKIKKLGQANDWSMGTSTASRIKRMLGSLKENANRHQLRYNTMTAEAFGNSIKENHPLLYDIGNGMIVEEYICPDSWKKNVGKKVPIGVYHNIEQEIPELPDWQIVGTAEIFGWDDEDGSDYVKYNYDYDKIETVFKKLGEYNWLTPALRENGTSDISTAYYCDVDIQWNDKLQKTIRVQTNIELISISFVPRGNCPGEVCSIKVVKHNNKEMQTYIKNCLNDGMEKAVCLASAYKKFKVK